MNIKGVQNDMSTERLARLAALKKGNAKQPQKTSVSRDKADTSELSQLLSNSMRELSNLTRERADKIAAFKATIDDPVTLSDQVVDTIFERMMNG